MQAEDILTATHKLEDSGMTRSESEAIANTIIAAVAPLATKADLESMKEATKADLESMRGATKVDLESMREQMATKADLESLKEHLATKADIEKVYTKIESAKLWLSITLLGLSGTLLAVATAIAVYAIRVAIGA